MANGNAPEALSGIPQPVYQYSRQLHKALENITPKVIMPLPKGVQ